MSTWRERLASEAVRKRVGELRAQDPEVRLLGLLLGEPKLYEWALSLGTARDPVLRSLAPPLPPGALRRITADDAPEMFLWTGLVDVEQMLRLCQEHRLWPEGRAPLRPRLLDFGCGCGRLLRFLTSFDDLLELHGTDVNAQHVEWCREFLAPLTFATNGSLPPLSYRDGTFDGIWSLSVFTHLDERGAEDWRAELARVLAPGGVLIATAHGANALAKIEAAPDSATTMRFDAERLRTVQRRFAAEGFVFLPYERDALSEARAGDTYGFTFTSADYIARRWNDRLLELVAHLPGGLRGWQDVVVLRRRAAGQAARRGRPRVAADTGEGPPPPPPRTQRGPSSSSLGCGRGPASERNRPARGPRAPDLAGAVELPQTTT